MSFLRYLTPHCVLFLFLLSPLMASETQSPIDVSPSSEQEEIDSINQLSSPDGPEVESVKRASSELTGVMVDRTITMAGKTFYRAFSQRAMDNLIIGNATITIQERPDARWGSQIWVMDGNRMYFRTQLSQGLVKLIAPQEKRYKSSKKRCYANK